MYSPSQSNIYTLHPSRLVEPKVYSIPPLSVRLSQQQHQVQQIQQEVEQRQIPNEEKAEPEDDHHNEKHRKAKSDSRRQQQHSQTARSAHNHSSDIGVLNTFQMPPPAWFSQAPQHPHPPAVIPPMPPSYLPPLSGYPAPSFTPRAPPTYPHLHPPLQQPYQFNPASVLNNPHPSQVIPQPPSSSSFAYQSVLSQCPARTPASARLLGSSMGINYPPTRADAFQQSSQGRPKTPSMTAYERATTYPHPRDRPNYNAEMACNPAGVGQSRFKRKKAERARQKKRERDRQALEAMRFGGTSVGTAPFEHFVPPSTRPMREMEAWFFYAAKRRPHDPPPALSTAISTSSFKDSNEMQLQQQQQQQQRRGDQYTDDIQHAAERLLDGSSYPEASRSRPVTPRRTRSRSNSVSASPQRGGMVASPSSKGLSVSASRAALSSSAADDNPTGGNPDLESPLQKWKRQQAEQKAAAEEAARLEKEQRGREAAIALKARLARDAEAEAEAASKAREAQVKWEMEQAKQRAKEEAERKERKEAMSQIAHEHKLKKAEDYSLRMHEEEREREKERERALAILEKQQLGLASFSAPTKSRQLKGSDSLVDPVSGRVVGETAELAEMRAENVRKAEESSRKAEEARLKREEEIRRRAAEKVRREQEVKMKKMAKHDEEEALRKLKEDEIFQEHGHSFKPNLSTNEPLSPGATAAGLAAASPKTTSSHSRTMSRSSSFSMNSPGGPTKESGSTLAEKEAPQLSSPKHRSKTRSRGGSRADLSPLPVVVASKKPATLEEGDEPQISTHIDALRAALEEAVGADAVDAPATTDTVVASAEANSNSADKKPSEESRPKSAAAEGRARRRSTSKSRRGSFSAKINAAAAASSPSRKKKSDDGVAGAAVAEKEKKPKDRGSRSRSRSQSRSRNRGISRSRSRSPSPVSRNAAQSPPSRPMSAVNGGASLSAALERELRANQEKEAQLQRELEEAAAAEIAAATAAEAQRMKREQEQKEAEELEERRKQRASLRAEAMANIIAAAKEASDLANHAANIGKPKETDEM